MSWNEAALAATASDPAQQGRLGIVDVAVEGAVVVLTIRGCLDRDTGLALVEAAAAAVGDDARRVDIDLRDVQSFTPEGADALVTCRSLTVGLEEGLHYRTGRGPGRAALLAAYSGDRRSAP